ncbi:mechanosensitive ion channel domain-containing protein [Piscinibacter sp.]|uniref:mechanosensitive ion channel family protein n=1 Tax=Piscinibacter sp. TaxID=1903157 RepID=UPI001DED3FAA|nr:mechanosensitive ion channel domain-containing protein [Piscinibacter sp.]MBK7531766.1 mechanosensitive ion channel [Piscinibacter sp.]
MTRTLDTTELNDLLGSLTNPTALAELGVLVGCLLLAWAIVRLLRGRAPTAGSIWFGERIIDGVLFPMVALALAFGARLLLSASLKIAVFKVAIPILVSLLVIRLAVRVLRVTFPDAHWVRVIERTVSWIAWLAVVLWITGVLPLLLEAMDEVSWKVGATRLTLRNLVEGTLTAGLVMVVALWISAAIEKQLLRGSGDDLSIRKIAANLVRALLLFLGLILALSAVGIDLTALSVLGGAVGVGLGFGLQKIAANYVSGFVILAERSLRIGDMVRVDNFDGRVTDIRTRYTVIRALSGREAIVPNEMLITQRVENLSLADMKVLLATTVQVAYGTDVRALQARLTEAVANVPRVLKDPAPSCQLAEFAADGMNLTINFWIADPENGQGNVRSDVNLAILDLFDREGIEIPFPQRVMHHIGVDPAAGKGGE